MNQVLVIDNCKFTQELLSKGLSANGYETTEATSGRRGIEKAAELRPNIILVSLAIDDITSIRLIRMIRAEPNLETTPIIALDKNGELRLEAFAAGCDDVVGKPFSFDELSARVNRFLRRSRQSETTEKECYGAKWIALHSLRGGVGSSSIAVNVALMLNHLWGSRTLLVDAAPWGGLLGQHLNRRSHKSWAELIDFDADQIDRSVARSILDRDPNGLDFIHSPATPMRDPSGAMRNLQAVLENLSESYDYFVIDGISALDSDAVDLISRADTTLIVSKPELYSLANASTSIRTLVDYGVSRDKLDVVISHASWSYGMSAGVVEQAFEKPVRNWIRFAPDEFQRASKSGEPVAMSKRYSNVVRDLEDLVLSLSKTEHLLVPPPSPSCKWRRLKQRWGSFPDPNSDVVRQEAKSPWRWPFKK